MTVIIKYPVNGWPPPSLPEDVKEWMDEHPECNELEDQFYYGYRIIVFRDDWSATAFKLKFLDRLRKNERIKN